LLRFDDRVDAASLRHRPPLLSGIALDSGDTTQWRVVAARPDGYAHLQQSVLRG
jgi:hypothetical protein